MNKKKINEIFTRFAKQNPEPKTELIYQNEFTLLVAIILSAQATDISVNKATASLFKIADNPKDILKIGVDGIKSHIKSIGLYNGKALNIYKLSQILIEQYNEKIPSSLKELISLPGVGAKTAAVFLNCAHKEPRIAVDTHVFRVSNRIHLTKAKNVVESETQLAKNVPHKWQFHAHHWLILHGRYTCKARKPECSRCIINDLCEYEAKSI